ncbi:helix-turn-helix domain-containing protein [Arthrobacter sp. AFG20]|uniref:helix-turn-helix domain-containing protein n=1 Tax=Arthrobacter sp. AFG20 TaxID=1688671 RepID=UPI0015E12708|nr:helix-turn-helix domain-containing protein [Arthrobacter sp. AFG20]
MDGDAGSVEQALSSGDIHELLKVWEDFNRGETWREISATGSGQARTAAAQFLAEVSEVAALEALRANAKAVELLTARRWHVIKSAREGGATWAQIGEALGITRQAAHHFYRRKIE